MEPINTFDALTPDFILNAIESHHGTDLTGLTAPLPSYINRVYELQDLNGERLIAKFYRPGRWSRAALQDEHNFVNDCFADELPVVAPLTLNNGETIGEMNGIFFALFPKKSGREIETHLPDIWTRLGQLVGRIHLAGIKRDAKERLRLHPQSTTIPEIEQLIHGDLMAKMIARQFLDITSRITDIALKEFEGIELQRIHGDCHCGNILERPETGLMVIDFDDMMTGPAIQDLWLLLPDHANQTRHEMNLILEGYERFMDFDDRAIRLIEILRAMRIIYFLAWCSKQKEDYKFQQNFPGWGSNAFWQREIADLEHQYQVIINDDRLKSSAWI